MLILISIIYQERVELLVLACVSAGIAPICCINPIVSRLTHSSSTLPSMIVRKSAPTKDTFLPEGSIPIGREGVTIKAYYEHVEQSDNILSSDELKERGY
jgi:hypothetical protein